LNPTQGPWKVVDLYEVQAGSLRIRQNYELGLTDDGELEHAKDNAKLIAAAPDLLNICKMVLAQRQGANCNEYGYSRNEIENEAKKILKRFEEEL
jgi:hypothetical protein